MYARTKSILAGLGVDTVCAGANCPNRMECHGSGVAAFLILGPVCTRNCAFCNIASGRPRPVDPGEPDRVAEAARQLGLSHVVVTSVTRDDLADGGASRFAAVLDALSRTLPGASREVLIPDFAGNLTALETVLAAAPAVLNHNLETVPELYARIRPGADYARSLAILRRARDFAPGGQLTVKSGLMLGLGETLDQVRRVLADLARAGCDVVTVGQYLAPSPGHAPVARYVSPEEFTAVAALGRDCGIKRMHCGPLVRSSFHAAEFV